MFTSVLSVLMQDTRQGDEFDVSCIPGARHVDFDKRNIRELAQTLDPSKPSVFVRVCICVRMYAYKCVSVCVCVRLSCVSV